MRSQSLAVKFEPQAPETLDLPPARVAHYGGMVGEILRQIEDRMTHPAPAIALEQARPARVDPVHLLSVAAGYVGLACGFGVAGLLMSWAL